MRVPLPTSCPSACWLGWSALGAAILLGIPFRASASPSVDPARTEMHEFYRKQTQESLSIFGSPPMGHVIPRRDHINLALNGDYSDLAIAPQGQAISDPKLTYKLKQNGWGVAPFVAFSGDNFGIGFAGEGGLRKLTYEYRTLWWSESTRQGTEHVTQAIGTAEYSGVGLYGYFMPTFKFLPKYIVTNFVAGGKQLYVVHYTETKGSYGTPLPKQKYRYAVKKYDVGLDLGVSFAKRFTVLPWVNYTFVSPGAASLATGEKAPDDDLILRADRDFFWGSLPRLTYGIDFAARVFQTEIHFGSLLAVVGNLFKGSDRISDKTISLGISYEVK